MKSFLAAALVVSLLVGCGDDSASCWAKRAAITAENDLAWRQYESEHEKWQNAWVAGGTILGTANIWAGREATDNFDLLPVEPRAPRLAELPNCE